LKLTEKQKRFADYYIETGNATEAYKRAYNSKNDNTAAKEGHKLLRNPKITQEIESRNKQLESDRIVSMEEVKRFWSDTIRNEEVDYKHRLKASEYIAKTNAAFIEKQEVDSKMSITIEGDVKEWAK
jgi:phage terminase small subunit